ncbi:MAG: GNAT family N-acetyltransferase [Rhizobiaceae bacterium]|nr:GNAT family N-acetyltransferase [Rhizobiaceae bacterium]
MLRIRHYEGADRDAAIGLFLELNRHEHTICADLRTDAGGAEFCVDDMVAGSGAGVEAIVAEWDGCVAGLMVWTVREDEGYIEQTVRKHGLVQDIVVSSTHRGKGIGRSLLAEAERLTRAAGLSRLKLTVLEGNPAADLYLNAGYRPHARVMIKTLD